MIVVSNPWMPDGRQVLCRDDRVVWCGPLGAPTEDVDYDKMIVSQNEYERIMAATDKDRR